MDNKKAIDEVSGDSRPAAFEEDSQSGGEGMNEDNPTIRQLLFDYIVNYKRQHDGLSPWAKEIADACSISESTVKYYLLRLENEGRIRLNHRRGIEVIGGGWEYDDH
ncbi:MAG TPA: winged helix-turn-helix domain-containing protein [Aggregatilineaceae bacterium]|nr:winged helix-turn-helix domain-containing protein [Aggregatilineaceae bacterium]